MSDTLADLSSHFHHHNHHHLHHHNHHPMDTTTNNHHKTPFLFPSDFPYEFASSSSNESESDDDEFSGLTRRFTRSFSLQDRLQIPYPQDPLQKKRVFSGSPESTLNWPVSSPATPFLQPEDDPWDLIYAAAGQVARMKMEMELKMKMNNLNDDVFTNSRPLLVPPPRPVNIGPPPPPSHHHHHHHPNCTIWRSGNEEFIKQQQQFRYRVAGAGSYGVAGRCGGGPPVGFRQQPAWPPVPVENQRRQQPSNGFVAKPVLAGSAGGGRVAGGLKRECAGTGVFLPRRYSNDPPESKKKPACSPAHLPARVVQSLNKSMDPILPNIYGHTHSDYGTAIGGGGGGRKAVAVGRRSGGESAEVVLPQEWTY